MFFRVGQEDQILDSEVTQLDTILLKEFKIQLRRQHPTDRPFMGKYDTLFELLHEFGPLERIL